MTIDTLIIFAGAFVAVLPFLGFPAAWDTVFFVIAGVFIISLGIALRRRSVARRSREAGSGAIRESGPLLRGDHDSR